MPEQNSPELGEAHGIETKGRKEKHRPAAICTDMDDPMPLKKSNQVIDTQSSVKVYPHPPPAATCTAVMEVPSPCRRSSQSGEAMTKAVSSVPVQHLPHFDTSSCLIELQ